MQIKYLNSLPAKQKKEILDPLVKESLTNHFQGFDIKEMNKNWTQNDLYVSFIIKKGPIERDMKGLIKVNETSLQIDFDVPEIVKNFVTEEKIKKAIFEKLESAFTK
ncbi:MAG: hypothetical protein Q8903_01585 [Bacteroidota bacterium]|nr:hypothetical protein [Bacteroidota bacterium]